MKVTSVSLSDLNSVSKEMRLLSAFRSRLDVVRCLRNRKFDYLEERLEGLVADVEFLFQAGALVDDEYTKYFDILKDFGGSKKEFQEMLSGSQKDHFQNHRHDFVTRFVDSMERVGRESRGQEWCWRVSEACEDYFGRGWFVIFDTLTVDGHSYAELFADSSPAWRKYIRSFANRVPGEHQYFACLESGKHTKRLHIHVLHFCERLPLCCEDPNKGRRIPNHRVFQTLSSLWPYGFSKPMAVRLHPHDAYGVLGYRWPVENGEALKASSPGQVAEYVSKYITKTHNLKGQCVKWRTKASRNLGYSRLNKLLKSWRNKDLCLLLQYRYPEKIVTRTRTLPRRCLRGVVLRILMKRIGRSCVLRSLLVRLRAGPNMISRVKSLTRRLRACSRVRTGECVNPRPDFISSLWPDLLRVPPDGYYAAVARLRVEMGLEPIVRGVVASGSLVS